jgi:uroporphyrinogen decarboxylase
LEDSIVDTAENSPVQDYLLDAVLDWMMAFGGGILEQIGEYIEFFWVGDDWGAQEGCFYSPDTFRRVFKPRLAKLIAHLKTKTQAKCVYHCCGSVYWVIPDMIDIGVDVLHPLQPSAKENEDTEKIKREFGDKIGFHGGTNNQGLFHKTEVELGVDTLKRINDLAPGGGYIFSSGHNIQANMPAKNILALFRLGREFGRYPIEEARLLDEVKKLQADYT